MTRPSVEVWVLGCVCVRHRLHKLENSNFLSLKFEKLPEHCEHCEEVCGRGGARDRKTKTENVIEDRQRQTESL